MGFHSEQFYTDLPAYALHCSDLPPLNRIQWTQALKKRKRYGKIVAHHTPPGPVLNVACLQFSSFIMNLWDC